MLAIVVLVGVWTALGITADTPPTLHAQKILQRFMNEFVDITPGQGKYPETFIMGTAQGSAAEQPARKVTIPHAFSLTKYEVTQELYEAVMGTNPSRWKGPRNSVEMVNWHEANAFCAKATKVLRANGLLKNNDMIRLPSEAEWEYACRAGTTGPYSFGTAEKDLGIYGWFTGNAKGNDPPVGAKKPNPWGLFDMHGYVWEWCADAWYANYQDAPKDGRVRMDDKVKERVLRGGAWTEIAGHCRSAYRHRAPAETRTAAIGFRCVKVTRVNQGKE